VSQRRGSPERARAVAAPTLRRPSRGRLRPAIAGRWAPSTRSLAVGFGLLLAAAGAYAVARESSIFALTRIEVIGAPSPLAAQIRAALAPLVGESLVGLSTGDADRRLARLPEVATATYDRDFPHTLRVFVTAERPAAILRRGADAWLVSGSNRVLGTVRQPITSTLPRVWLAPTDEVVVGAPADRTVTPAVLVAAAIRDRGFPYRVTTIRVESGRVSLRLGSGVEVRLGDTRNLGAKLAVARAVVPRAGGALYVDVSVLVRPVAGFVDSAAASADVSPTASTAGA
jgi:cell division protein FtsQ